MNTRQLWTKRQPGFILIEALVALVVVAVGILGVAKLNALLLSGTGFTKERAEALQLAQRAIESMRNFDLNSGCSDVFLEPGNPMLGMVDGTNATFNVQLLSPTAAPSVDDDFVNVSMCVTWNGGDCGVPGNRVVFNTVVACSSLGTSALVGTGAEGGGGRSGFIKTPTGRARVGGTLDPNAKETGADSTSGTKTYLNPDGTRVLVDKNGVVVLSMAKLSACEAEAPDFSSIEGRIYVELDNADKPLVAESDLFALSSDASFCSRQLIADAPKLSYTDGVKTKKFAEVTYKCFVGAEWWGNIGLVSTAKQVPPAARVCQGDPGSVNISTLFSKHPQLKTSRGYRGYRSLDSDKNTWMSKGIGETDSLATQCGPNQFSYVAVHYTGHHFVYGSIGSDNASDCVPVETGLKSASGSKYFIAAGDPVITKTPDATNPVLVTSAAQNNPGVFYCMSADDGLNCPKLDAGVFEPATKLTGTLSGDVPPDLQLKLIDDPTDPTADGISCEVGNGKYTCNVNWEGSLGQSWSGYLHFKSATKPLASLCSSPAPSSTDPLGVNVTYGVNQQDATVASKANTVDLANIPLYLKQLTINLTYSATASACGLAAPVAKWENPTTSQTISTITWDSVVGADGYRYTTCVNPSNTCVPPAPTMTDSSASSPFTPLSMTENQIRCYRFASANTSVGIVGPATAVELCVRYATSKGKLVYSYAPF